MAIAFPEPLLNGSARTRPAGVPNGDRIPLCRPTVPDSEALIDEFRDIIASGVLTNGPRVREFERRASDYLGVRHCIAVSSCTSGLMLVLRAAELSGDVIVPSFTFAATAHAVSWCGLRPVFADIDPETLTLSLSAALRAIGMRTSAILATHTYGVPCDVDGLTAIAERNGIRLFFDAAHAFGSRRGDTPVGGFGDAEVFSLSPTKVVVAAEGGLIATNEDVLAERCRIGRDYGNPGDYDCRFVGLNARLSEFHAALGAASLTGLDERIEYRNALATWYREELSDVPGLTFPSIPEGSRSTYKDLTILIDRDLFGISAAELGSRLAESGIETRRYFDPPVHVMRAYQSLRAGNGHLPITERVASQVISLPLWGGLTRTDVLRVTAAVRDAQSLVQAG